MAVRHGTAPPNVGCASNAQLDIIRVGHAWCRVGRGTVASAATASEQRDRRYGELAALVMLPDTVRLL